MKLYLMRHGKPEEFATSSDPALSVLGSKELEQNSKAISKATEKIDFAFTSPLRRARETAEIVLEGCHFTDIPQVVDHLSPEAHPERILSLLSGLPPEARVICFTHMPLVVDLVRLFLNAESSVVHFDRGTIASLAIAGAPGKTFSETSAVLEWVLPPTPAFKG